MPKYPIAVNEKTGDMVYWDGAKWTPVRKADNPDTNESIWFDGEAWQPLERPKPEREGFIPHYLGAMKKEFLGGIETMEEAAASMREGRVPFPRGGGLHPGLPLGALQAALGGTGFTSAWKTIENVTRTLVGVAKENVPFGVPTLLTAMRLEENLGKLFQVQEDRWRPTVGSEAENLISDLIIGVMPVEYGAFRLYKMAKGALDIRQARKAVEAAARAGKVTEEPLEEAIAGALRRQPGVPRRVPRGYDAAEAVAAATRQPLALPPGPELPGGAYISSRLALGEAGGLPPLARAEYVGRATAFQPLEPSIFQALQREPGAPRRVAPVVGPAARPAIEPPSIAPIAEAPVTTERAFMPFAPKPPKAPKPTKAEKLVESIFEEKPPELIEEAVEIGKSIIHQGKTGTLLKLSANKLLAKIQIGNDVRWVRLDEIADIAPKTPIAARAPEEVVKKVKTLEKEKAADEALVKETPDMGDIDEWTQNDAMFLELDKIIIPVPLKQAFFSKLPATAEAIAERWKILMGTDPVVKEGKAHISVFNKEGKRLASYPTKPGGLRVKKEAKAGKPKVVEELVQNRLFNTELEATVLQSQTGGKVRQFGGNKWGVIRDKEEAGFIESALLQAFARFGTGAIMGYASGDDPRERMTRALLGGSALGALDPTIIKALMGKYKGNYKAAHAAMTKLTNKHLRLLPLESISKHISPKVYMDTVEISRRYLDEAGKEMLMLPQLQNVLETGTLQPKAIRSRLTRTGGKPKTTFAKPMVSPALVERTKEELVGKGAAFLGTALRVAQGGGEGFVRTELLKLAASYRKSVAKFFQVRRQAGMTLREYQEALRDLEAAGFKAMELADIAPRVAIFNGPGGLADRIRRMMRGEDVSFVSETFADMVTYMRRNLFTPLSWMKDTIGNTGAVMAGVWEDAASDILLSFSEPSVGLKFPRTKGTFKAAQVMLRSQVRGLTGAGEALKRGEGLKMAHAQWAQLAGGSPYLPPELRPIMGRIAYSEKWLPLFSPKAAETEVGRIAAGVAEGGISHSLYFKAVIDTGARRLSAMAELSGEAYKDAYRRGLTGKDLVNHFEQYMDDLPEEMIQAATDRANRQSFMRDLPLGKTLDKLGDAAWVQLFVTPFPRWNMQFTRFMLEQSPLSPDFWHKVNLARRGEYILTADDIARYAARSMVGVGAVKFVDQVLYDNVDFTTMSYQWEDGSRSWLLGLTPLNELLAIAALFRGDLENAGRALIHSSIVLGPLVDGEEGIFGRVIDKAQQFFKGDITPSQAREELERTLNIAVPAQGTLKNIERLLDPTQRVGFFANIPGVSERAEPRIDPTTGEPRQQMMTGIFVPYLGRVEFGKSVPAVSVPGAINERLTSMELEANRLGIKTFYGGRQRPLLEFEAEDVPKELRQEYLKIAGQTAGRTWGVLMGNPDFVNMYMSWKDIDRRKIVDKVFNIARRTGVARMNVKDPEAVLQRMEARRLEPVAPLGPLAFRERPFVK